MAVMPSDLPSIDIGPETHRNTTANTAGMNGMWIYLY